MIKMAINKREFQSAFREAVSAEFADIPAEKDIEYSFSDSFHKKMNQLIKSQKSFYWKLVNTAAKRVAVIFVLLLILTTMTFSVKAFRDPMVKFFKVIYDTFTQYFFADDTATVIEKEYKLNYIPDGFVEIMKAEDDFSITSTFMNDTGDTIEFWQMLSKNLFFVMDNENAKTETKVIAEKIVDIYEKYGIKTVVWSERDYAFMLSFEGHIDMDTIIRIIEKIS